MVNALCSLTMTYQMPLLILASWRGIYRERISAQVPFGSHLVRILEALNINHSIVESSEDLPLIGDAADNVFKRSSIHIILLSPKLTETEIPHSDATNGTRGSVLVTCQEERKPIRPLLPRSEILR